MLQAELLEKQRALSGVIGKEVIFTGGGSGGGVGGITQEELEEALETKVDKTSESNKIYGTDENGNQKKYSVVSTTYTTNSIVQRSATGTIATADPQWGNDATNKRYVDTKIADLVNSAPETLDTLGEIATALEENDDVVEALNSAIGNKLDKQTPEFDAGATRGYVYFIDPDHNQIVKKVQIQANADTIPLRNPNGNFYVGDATLPYEAVNKGYVDDLVGDINTALETILGV